MKTKYDVVILGSGHNALVAAGYLAGAGLSVLVLEKNDYLGGATTSQRVFPDYDARISRYAYLVSLLPQQIIQDLGLNLQLRTRDTASFTPYERDGVSRGLLLSNLSASVSRSSLRQLIGHNREWEQFQRFYQLARIFAQTVWPTLLEPLPGVGALERRFQVDDLHREAWRSLVAEPLGAVVERYLQNDLLRGVVFTDAKIGLLTHPEDPSLLQNRCFLYHTMGNVTGEWKVPVGGMGRVAGELIRVATRRGAVMVTRARLLGLELSARQRTVHCEVDGQPRSLEARYLLVNFGPNVLAHYLGRGYEPGPTHEGSVLKINLLLRRLPRLRNQGVTAREAFQGTFHVDEGYEQMKVSHAQAAQSALPDRVPCEVYCHTLTDDSILAPELSTRGFQTMTLFGLDTPWRSFVGDPAGRTREAAARCLAGLNRWLAEPLEDCLARDADGQPCMEIRNPLDLEAELGHYRGNIFHGALTFPFADSAETTGTWGVETEWTNVLLCGSGARRGGAVSGIPGHNAARKVLELERADGRS